MSNIFGKEFYDYKYLVEAKKKDKQIFDQLVRDGFTGKGHDFNALGQQRQYAPMQDKRMVQDDPAQGVTWFTNNLEAIQAEIEEIFYSKFRLDDYFPINTNIPEGASSYACRVVDRQGRGKFIENYGTNAETANVTAQKIDYQMGRGGIVPQWSDEDLRAAIFGGIPLDSETIRAGTEGCMQHIEQVGLGTDTEARFEGLLNLSNVPSATNTAGTWDTLTPDQIVKQINSYVTQVIINTNQIFSGKIDTTAAIYVSLERAALLIEPRATFSDTSIWSYIRNNNFWTQQTGKTLDLKTVQEFTDAGAGGTQLLLVGYPDDKDVWEMGMSISPRVMRIVPQTYYFQAPMEYKISGLNVKRPGGLLYVNDI